MTTLNNIVNDYILETGDTSQHNYARFYRFGERALQELSLDVKYKVKTIVYNPDPSTMSYPLPKDYVDYLRIGTVKGNQIIPFGINTDIAFNRQFTNCGAVADYANFPYNNYGDYVWGAYASGGVYPPHSINGEVIGAYSGLGGGQRLGYYRIDEQYGVIQFSEIALRGEIYMEYLVSVSPQENGELSLSEFDAEAVLAFISWRHAQNNKSFSPTEAERRKNEYYNQKRLAKKRHRRPNIQELLQAIHKSFQAAPHI